MSLKKKFYTAGTKKPVKIHNTIEIKKKHIPEPVVVETETHKFPDLTSRKKKDNSSKIGTDMYFVGGALITGVIIYERRR